MRSFFDSNTPSTPRSSSRCVVLSREPVTTEPCPSVSAVDALLTTTCLMITNSAELTSLVERLRKQSSIAIDCEFQGEGRYQPLLCLVQLFFEGEGHIIDPFEVDLTPLGEVLADARIEKLFHAGSNDIPLLARATGRQIENVFDTQIAAGFVGMGASPSYVSLVERVTGISLAKTSRFTDWSKRPLSTEQLTYALDDVRHLAEVSEFIKQELDRHSRTAWAHRATEEMVIRALQPRDRYQLYLRVGPHKGMSRRRLGILREVVAWRDRRAEEIDRPVGRVVNDEALRQLVFQPPHSVADLTSRRGLQGIGRAATDLLEAVQRGQALPDSELPPALISRASDERSELVSMLLATALRIRANELDIAPSVIANRDQLEALAIWHFAGRTGHAPELITPGSWKREAAGELLVAFLDGHYSLQIDPDAVDGVALAPADARRVRADEAS
jgi:ribonuclease D